MPHRIIEFVNQDIEEINSTSLIGNELRKLVKQKQTKIIKLLEKELKIVPKGYYKKLWLGLVNPAIGSALGSRMDKKAFEEGRQLDVKI